MKCEVAVKGRNGTPFRNGTERLFSLPTRERERRWELGRRCSLYMSFGQARFCGFCVHIHPSVLVVTFAANGSSLQPLCSTFFSSRGLHLVARCTFLWELGLFTTAPHYTAAGAPPPHPVHCSHCSPQRWLHLPSG
jgi:hypothetical protein